MGERPAEESPHKNIITLHHATHTALDFVSFKQSEHYVSKCN